MSTAPAELKSPFIRYCLNHIDGCLYQSKVLRYLNDEELCEFGC